MKHVTIFFWLHTNLLEVRLFLLAAERGHFKIVEYLAGLDEKGANVNNQDHNGVNICDSRQ